ncbi:HIT domain-containing protein [Chelatococcus sp. SYSU_G07232]|uniref:HIT domain-containing protein n=1 Tax=Chelatococcus albus TaxID=3047466 RepID=A0ABT7AF92_9HYPH|nr:HIT domain-containing protein [Chelatococcus sp. SYSU_G07232]MDJ1157672.1 HIT domain-containing protein [Chelatococcus sp. SYSU_G07232]
MSESDVSSDFALDSRLAADTMPIGDLGLSRLLLMNDARFPWVILVPRRPGMRDLIDLDEIDAATLLTEIRTVACALRDLVSPDKLNVAALGNMVPQLHVHVIARFTQDAAWPKPVWGIGGPEPYEAAVRDAFVTDLARAVGLA